LAKEAKLDSADLEAGSKKRKVKDGGLSCSDSDDYDSADEDRRAMYIKSNYFQLFTIAI